jgi:hypothetical protein
MGRVPLPLTFRADTWFHVQAKCAAARQRTSSVCVKTTCSTDRARRSVAPQVVVERKALPTGDSFASRDEPVADPRSPRYLA